MAHHCCAFEGDPGRDPRGHTITVAFMAWAPSRAACNARAGDDAAEACFFPVERLPTMAFDHLKVRCYAIAVARTIKGERDTGAAVVMTCEQVSAKYRMLL